MILLFRRYHLEQDRLIRSNDILVLNSLLEGEPLVIREACFRSMKIVARDITGVRGVATYSERYISQANSSIFSLQFSNPNFPKYASPSSSMSNESNYKRASAIFKLYNLISRNLSEII